MSSEIQTFTTFYRHGAPHGDTEGRVEILLTVEHGTAGAAISLQARQPGLDGDIAIEPVRLEGSDHSVSTTARLEPGYASELVYEYHPNGTRVSPELRLLVVVRAAGSRNRREIEHLATSRDQPELVLNILAENEILETNRVAVSTDPAYPVLNSLELFIQNPGASALIEFENEGGLNPDDPLPPIAGPNPGPRLDRLYVYFPYGEASGTLTTREQAAGITVSPAPDNDSWYVSQMSSPDIGPYWILFPKHEYVLAAHESVRFQITGVTTFNPPALTHLSLEKRVTGYQAATDSATLLRLADVPPKVLSFESSDRTVPSGTTVELSWQTWNAKSCELKPEGVGGLPANEDAYPVRVLRDVNFGLTAKSPSGKTSEEATRQVYVDPVRIESFTADPEEVAPGLPVTLRWETHSARSVRIEPDVGTVCEDAAGCNTGEIEVYPAETVQFQLVATGEEGPVTATAKVRVEPFSPFPKPPFDEPVRPLRADNASQWADELLGTKNWSLRLGTFEKAEQAARSITEFGTLASVIVEGRFQPLRRLSYVAVAGPGAPYVDVAVYPPSENGLQNYQGWDGTRWVNGPAKPVNGYYWYRLEVIWTDEVDPSAVFFAKDYRLPGYGKAFQLWAYEGVDD